MANNPYDNATFMDTSLWCYDDSFSSAIDSIYKEIEPYLGMSTKRYRETYIRNLKVAVLNLSKNYLNDSKRYTVYSRDRMFFEYQKNRYNKNNVSNVIIKIFDALNDSGFIDDAVLGYQFGDKNRRRSRIRSSYNLIAILDKYDRKKHKIIKNREIIELRDKKRLKSAKKKNGKTKRVKEKKGKLIDYKDTALTNSMRNNLNLINSFLEQQVISISSLTKKLHNAFRHYQIDFNDNTLRRVFSIGSFEYGGRFYGHWVQSLPKRYRKSLRINGQPVCEYDYQEFHIRLLYDFKGIDPPHVKDMYRVLGFSPLLRPFLKKLLNAHLCADSPVKAIKGVHSELEENDDLPKLNEPEIKRFSKLLMAKHKAVADHMNRGFGIKLQNIDSQITEKILLRLTRKKIPVIPIHDSFIVQIKHEAELKRAMTDEYEKKIGKKPLFKKVY